MAVSPSLIRWCSGELSRLLSTEMTEEYARYILGIDDDNELEEYLGQLLDRSDSAHSGFISELISRRKGVSAGPQNFTVYRKSAAPEAPGWKETKSKGKSRSKEKKAPPHQEQTSAPGTKSGAPPTTLANQQVQQAPVQNGGLPPEEDHALALQQGARRKTKYVALYSQEGQARSAIHYPGRHPCECQAHKHALVSNCLECGRVVCSQEGSGPCLFCGALVCNREEQEILARNSKKSEKLRKKLMGEGARPVNGDLDKAIAHKDRLIEFDKTSVRRTQVVDDQSDYFSSDSNRWLNKKERDLIKKREDSLREKRHGSRLNKKFSLDFAGRKVEEEAAQEMYDVKDDVVQRVTFGNKQAPERTKGGSDQTILNPTITRDAPKFVSPESNERGRQTSSISAVSQSASKGSQRVQDKELMEMSDEGHCLSMHQPWASLLVAGIKIHEGRTWYSAHRGRLWVAAAAKVASQEDIEQVQAVYRHLNGGVEFPEHYPTGCLLGCVDMVDCLAQEEYRLKFPDGESTSPFVFICENAQELLFKFQLKGRHKIWRLDGQTHKAAKRGLRQVLQSS